MYNRYSTLPTDEEDAASMNGAFTEAGSRRVLKRRRQQSRASSQQPQQQQQQQYRGSSGYTATIYQRTATVAKRGRVMLTGKATQTGQDLTAARKLVRKAIFCVDNIQSSVNAD